MAKIAGLHRTRVSSWQRSRAAGGTDGRIPQKHIQALLAFAREQGLDLKAEDFLDNEAQSAPRPETAGVAR